MISLGHWVAAVNGIIAPTNAAAAYTKRVRRARRNERRAWPSARSVASALVTGKVWHRKLGDDPVGSGSVAIVPDTKDWTWVLQRPCPECDFDTNAFPREAIASMVRSNAQAWLGVLAGVQVGTRPSPDRWSPLEYACHVRDVFRLYDHRLDLMLTHDDPLYENWDQDETAVRERYGEQDPAQVGPQLIEAAQALANRFETVSGEQWQRPGRRSDGAVFTIETFGRYFIHDPVHHLFDATGVRPSAKPYG
jgi:DinB superfamily